MTRGIFEMISKPLVILNEVKDLVKLRSFASLKMTKGICEMIWGEIFDMTKILPISIFHVVGIRITIGGVK